MFPRRLWSYRRVLGANAMQLAQIGLYNGICVALCAARGRRCVVPVDVLHGLRFTLLWVLHGHHIVAWFSVVGEQEP